MEYKHFTDKILINQVFIDFDIWVENIPNEIDYTVGKWKIDRKNSKQNKLEKRIFSLYQFYSCGGIACRDGRCRHYNEALDKLANKLGIDLSKDKSRLNELKQMIRRFCHNCGKTGGHANPDTKCKRRCKWCGSHDYSGTIHPQCPFWNACGIITLLYNPYYVRNQMNPYGYLAWDGDLDPKWDMNFNLQIEESTLNKKIYPQLIRQLDILKWLCEKNDIFCTMDKHIQFLDKIFNVFNDTKKDYFEAMKKSNSIIQINLYLDQRLIWLEM